MTGAASVLPTVRELGIGFVPYSPLGRGFLTSAVKPADEYDETDFRRHSPRWQGDNFLKNKRAIDELSQLASEKGITPAQLALAWLLAQGDDVIPIPGTKRRRYLEENVGALRVRLTTADLLRIHQAVPPGAATGERYPEAGMRTVGR